MSFYKPERRELKDFDDAITINEVINKIVHLRCIRCNMPLKMKNFRIPLCQECRNDKFEQEMGEEKRKGEKE